MFGTKDREGKVGAEKGIIYREGMNELGEVRQMAMKSKQESKQANCNATVGCS